MTAFKHFINTDFWPVLCVLLWVMWLRAFVACSFYRGYFNQKQRNIGHDPNRTVELEMGTWIYRLFFKEILK